MNKQKGSVNIVLVIVIIILLGIVGYFAFIRKSTPIPQQTSNNSATQEKTVSGNTYKNDRFGFELNLTNSWKGYKVFSSEGSQGVGAPTYLEFAMPTTDKSRSVMSVTDEISGYASPLTITIIAKDRSYHGTGVKITEDSDNAYYYTINKDLPSDLQGINLEIPKIISSFKFSK